MALPRGSAMSSDLIRRNIGRIKKAKNASYYRLLPDKPRYYINDTGTGNTLNLSHARVIQMVTDNLRYWVEQTRIDGFRFDLGTILAREPNGFDNQSGFLKACSQDPCLARVKLIAEPWDCGPGDYQVGCFPPGWAEWNDKFRDTTRKFWIGHAPPAELTGRLCASGEFFNHQGRRPWTSINFVSAHDGFTLNDVFSYNEKHNQANGEDNKDGSSHNHSWNCGAEGPTDDPEIIVLRKRQIRNVMATLLLAQGTPCCWPATSSVARKAATTTLIARITRSAGSTGSCTRKGRSWSLLPGD
jgi:isoamylase